MPSSPPGLCTPVFSGWLAPVTLVAPQILPRLPSPTSPAQSLCASPLPMYQSLDLPLTSEVYQKPLPHHTAGFRRGCPLLIMEAPQFSEPCRHPNLHLNQ